MSDQNPIVALVHGAFAESARLSRMGPGSSLGEALNAEQRGGR